jgi:hypothetical protein
MSGLTVVVVVLAVVVVVGLGLSVRVVQQYERGCCSAWAGGSANPG